MLVFWEQRLAFLATPKTGSTAIAAALESLASVSVQRPPVLKHTTVHRYHRFLGPYFKAASGHEFTVVALMRDPRDWLGSWYRYRQRAELPDQDKSTAGMSFDSFVRAYAADPQPDFAAVGSQARFLRSKDGRGVDHLFRYDRIGDFVDFMEERLGCTVLLPRLNVSPQSGMRLAPGTEAMLARVAAEDQAMYDALA